MKKVCLISGSPPTFLGGMSLYQKNIIDYCNNNGLNYHFTWVYPGRSNRIYHLDKIRCIELKTTSLPIVRDYEFSKKVLGFLSREPFDIINSHANWGYFLKDYGKKDELLVHTYHGVTYPYYKVQFSRFGLLKYLFYPMLPFIKPLEKYPLMKADRIIAVSDKVKGELIDLYGIKRDIKVIRTGINLEEFKPINKDKARISLGLRKDFVYGLYSGRGGYWNKGLDRAISISKELFRLNKNFRLLVVGSDKRKCSKFLNHPFVEYKGQVSRKEIPYYYAASNFFFSLSRYEGGAPTLALSEAIASTCLVVCSKDSRPEIIDNGINGIIVSAYGLLEAKTILSLINNKRRLMSVVGSARRSIKNLSLPRWAREYLSTFKE